MVNDPDKQMVRTQGGDSFNLAVGEPFFIHSGRTRPEPWLRYPQYQGQPELLEELKKKHPGLHVVVANGAKQAILATLYAYQLGRHFPNEIFHEAPHWPSYPTLAKLSGGSFFCHRYYPSVEGTVTVITSPNNPDSRTFKDGDECHIWDAAYAHEVYGWNGKAPKHEVSIWSAAKLFGVSGLRVGWLVTANDRIAELAADYVEKTTSGVNVEAQLRVAEILTEIRENPEEVKDHYKEARQRLYENGYIFNQTVAPYCLQIAGLPATDVGMFAWFQPDMNTLKFKDALAEAKILLVSGTACGMDDSWFRMSLGQTPEVLKPQLERLAEVLSKQ